MIVTASIAMFSLRGSKNQKEDRQHAQDLVTNAGTFSSSLKALSNEPSVKKQMAIGTAKLESRSKDDNKKADAKKTASTNQNYVPDSSSIRNSSLAAEPQTQTYAFPFALSETAPPDNPNVEAFAGKVSMEGLSSLGESSAALPENSPKDVKASLATAPIPDVEVPSLPEDQSSQIPNLSAAPDEVEQEIGSQDAIKLLTSSKRGLPVDSGTTKGTAVQKPIASNQNNHAPTELLKPQSPTSDQPLDIGHPTAISPATAPVSQQKLPVRLRESLFTSEKTIAKHLPAETSKTEQQPKDQVVSTVSKSDIASISATEQVADSSVQTSTAPLLVATSSQDSSIQILAQQLAPTQPAAAPDFFKAGEPTLQTNETSTATVAPLHQLPPSINTSKLIQTLNQSEMNVGMRSAEFGKISIRTVSTSDLISAHISLEHDDLARTISTHVTEMQTKLGGPHTSNVQIEMNAMISVSTGSRQNNADDDSQNSKQQSPRTLHALPKDDSVVAEMTTYLPIATLSNAGNHLRLDVRV